MCTTEAQRLLEKQADLVTTVRTSTVTNKEQIETDAPPREDDWIQSMNHYIDQQGMEYINKDDFLTEIPPELLDSVKQELEPIVREDYVKTMFCFIFVFLNLINAGDKKKGKVDIQQDRESIGPKKKTVHTVTDSLVQKLWTFQNYAFHS